MVEKPRVLFVLSEGLQSTVIDSQVLQHARAFRNLGIAEFSIITLACTKTAYEEAEEHLQRAKDVAGCDVMILRGVRPGWPLSEFINGCKLAKFVSQQGIEFDKIHARTDYSAALSTVLARKSKKGIIWDCRGDFFAERIDRLPFGLKRFLMTIIVGAVYRRRLKMIERTAEAAIFVTTVLRDRMAKFWGTKKAVVIPGAASERLFFFDEELRQSVRARLKIDSDELLLVYGGSMIEYQKFPESLAYFDNLNANDLKVHYLVVTNQVEQAKRLVGDRKNVTVLSALLEEMNGYLNAGDAAFMIRDNLPLNAVAFPTKFAEYGLCGLPVIMNSAVPDAAKLAQKAGNYVNCDSGVALESFSHSERRQVARYYRARVTKQAQAQAYAGLYQVN
ncbi:MAG: hypothetical protein KTR23_01520 [Rhodospirillales bacterium]|nr:hypothetical protein [Rhodospirillales bacterium]